MIHPEVTTLYKYRAFNEQSLSILINKKIWCASPESFNDPFDCGAEISYKKEVAKLLIGKNVSPEEMKRHQEEFKKGMDHDSSLKDKKVGIFSLSEVNNEILMWSHYANNHKGFCIGFERNLDNLLGKDKWTHRIIYRDDIAHIEHKSTEQVFLEFYTKKSKKHWSYEKEWRYVQWPSEPNEIITNVEMGLPGKIESIVFGLKMPIEHKRTIINILEDEVDYYRVEKDKKLFKLNLFQLTKEEIEGLQKG